MLDNYLVSVIVGLENSLPLAVELSFLFTEEPTPALIGLFLFTSGLSYCKVNSPCMAF